MASPRLFAEKPSQPAEEKIAPPQTELSIHLSGLDKATEVLELNYTTAKNALINEQTHFSFQGIVRTMSTCEAILDLILHLYRTNALKNKDKTLEFNIHLAKESCQEYKQSPNRLEVFVTRYKELQKLQGLLAEIYLSCKADIDHKKIKYLKEHRPARCSIQ